MEQESHTFDNSPAFPSSSFFKALESRLSNIPAQKNRILTPELRDKNVFLVPNGYFESLESRLISNAILSTTKKAKVIYPIFFKRFAVAASMVLVALCTVMYLTKETPNKQIISELQTVSEAEIVAYLESSGTGNFSSEDFETYSVDFTTSFDGLQEDEIRAYTEQYGI